MTPVYRSTCPIASCRWKSKIMWVSLHAALTNVMEHLETHGRYLVAVVGVDHDR